jgi:hypothetical protein
MSEGMLAAVERLCNMGIIMWKSKCEHPLKTELLLLEEVQMTAEEDMKHVLSYVGYMATDRRLEKEINC